jgi:nucleoside-diphosphate-sugar epimerase
MPLIAEGLAGKTLLITGTTGFLGKSIVEKLLRSVPEVGRINLAIRSSQRSPAPPSSRSGKASARRPSRPSSRRSWRSSSSTSAGKASA